MHFQVGLGTDVSGGFSPSILNAIQNASIAAKVVALHSKPSDTSATKFRNKQLSVATLLYLATMGGAEVCDLKKYVGSFAPGKSFDALVVSVRNDAGNPALWGVDSELSGSNRAPESKESLDRMLERFLFCGDDRNISMVYVQGRLIGGKEYRH